MITCSATVCSFQRHQAGIFPSSAPLRTLRYLLIAAVQLMTRVSGTTPLDFCDVVSTRNTRVPFGKWRGAVLLVTVTSEPLFKHRARASRQAVIKHFTVQRVSERVSSRDRTVCGGNGRATSNEFTPLRQPVQKSFDPRLRLPSGVGDRRGGKALTRDAGGRERRSRIVIQDAQLHFNQGLQCRGNDYVVAHGLVEHM